MHASSWVEGADACPDFPLANLPLGIFAGHAGAAGRIGVAIGPWVLDVAEALRRGLLPGVGDALGQACEATVLNPLFALGHAPMAELRRLLVTLLGTGADAATRGAARECLYPRRDVRMRLPVDAGDYTDFLASYHHAFNVGSLYRPESPVLPNLRSLPAAYHGRSSTLVVDGAPVWRPRGQSRPHGAQQAVFGPSERLDMEVELGAIVGAGNERGRPIAVDEAEAHLAGLVLLNDWSARDIQAWETQPLGPFLGKNFATTLSPWVVTLQALAPFRTAAPARRPGDPPLMAYLDGAADRRAGGIDIHLQARLRTARMREQGLPAQPICSSRFARDCDWTLAQMLAHHTVNGCNLRPGDVIGSGTVSGPGEGEAGSLLELTHGGKKPLQLPGGETRRFLEDGDEVVLGAFCEAPGQRRIGFGECGGVVEAAP